MSYLTVPLGLMVLTHILCYAVMTERRYSVRRTVLIYALYAAFFVGSTLVLSVCLGVESIYTVGIAFSATIAAGFLIFIWTSSDVFCKKLFLFISYSNLFCIYHVRFFLTGTVRMRGQETSGTPAPLEYTAKFS